LEGFTGDLPAFLAAAGAFFRSELLVECTAFLAGFALFAGAAFFCAFDLAGLFEAFFFAGLAINFGVALG
jgi:hypothetical protein